MKKLLFVLCLSYFSAVNSDCQNIVIKNQLTFGGSAQDYTKCSIRTIDDGFLIGGYSQSNISGDKNQDSRGGSDYWVVKLDSVLHPMWQKTLGGDASDNFCDMAQAADGSIYLAGSSGTQVSGDKTIPNHSSEFDFWVLKLDANGNILWQSVYGGDGSEGDPFIIELSDHNILLAGTSNSDSSGNKTENSQGFSDYWLIKIDSSGTVIWDKTFGGDSYETLASIVEDDMGFIYLSGKSYSSASGDKTEDSFGSSDIWIVKADASGNKIWDRTIGGSSLEDVGRISAIGEVAYVIAQSMSDSSGTKTENCSGGSDYWITKIDALGNIIWDKTLGGIDYDIPFDVSAITVNQILLSGSSWSGISGDKTDPCIGFYDFWLISIDSSSNILWQKTIGGTDFDYLANTTVVSPDHFFVAGYSSSTISGDKTDYCRGMEDYWIVEISVTTGQEENEEGFFQKVYPNPTSGKIFIDMHGEKSDKFGFELYDFVGRKVFSGSYGNYLEGIDITSFEDGIYFISLFNENEVLGTGKIMKVAR